MQRLSKPVFYSLLILTSAACTHRSEVSPLQYRDYSCAALEDEIDKAGLTMTKGAVVLAATRFDNDVNEKLAFLRANYKAMKQAYDDKQCGLENAHGLSKDNQ